MKAYVVLPTIFVPAIACWVACTPAAKTNRKIPLVPLSVYRSIGGGDCIFHLSDVDDSLRDFLVERTRAYLISEVGRIFRSCTRS